MYLQSRSFTLPSTSLPFEFIVLFSLCTGISTKAFCNSRLLIFPFSSIPFRKMYRSRSFFESNFIPLYSHLLALYLLMSVPLLFLVLCLSFLCRIYSVSSLSLLVSFYCWLLSTLPLFHSLGVLIAVSLERAFLCRPFRSRFCLLSLSSL